MSTPDPVDALMYETAPTNAAHSVEWRSLPDGRFRFEVLDESRVAVEAPYEICAKFLRLLESER